MDKIINLTTSKATWKAKFNANACCYCNAIAMRTHKMSPSVRRMAELGNQAMAVPNVQRKLRADIVVLGGDVIVTSQRLW